MIQPRHLYLEYNLSSFPDNLEDYLLLAEDSNTYNTIRQCHYQLHGEAEMQIFPLALKLMKEFDLKTFEIISTDTDVLYLSLLFFQKYQKTVDDLYWTFGRSAIFWANGEWVISSSLFLIIP